MTFLGVIVGVLVVGISIETVSQLAVELLVNQQCYDPLHLATVLLRRRGIARLSFNASEFNCRLDQRGLSLSDPVCLWDGFFGII
ncbi:hypothetical protein KC19_11G076800 [Ceratodon purpureus]|uniref:Secreted protein n=1 Tax=Ceratodon purpureus TaxID=3225 RepID=A0A8T0GC36_CERPU|nr:hypothetical protein KC19_11G076800 [Ceratodon purpureus]